MSDALNYPILINPPKKVPVSVEQFDKLSYIGLASFFVNYPIAIVKRDNQYQMYMRDTKADIFFKKPRFKDINFWQDKSAEMVYCDIPFEHSVAKTIEKYYSHLIMS